MQTRSKSYAEHGRRRAGAVALRSDLRLHDPPERPRSPLRLVTRIDVADLRRSAADGYARAVVELHAARVAAVRAYEGGSPAERRRALRVVWAVNAEADRLHDELLAVER